MKSVDLREREGRGVSAFKEATITISAVNIQFQMCVNVCLCEACPWPLCITVAVVVYQVVEVTRSLRGFELWR